MQAVEVADSYDPVRIAKWAAKRATANQFVGADSSIAFPSRSSSSE